jgi:hypothetical protein
MLRLFAQACGREGVFLLTGVSAVLHEKTVPATTEMPELQGQV